MLYSPYGSGLAAARVEATATVTRCHRPRRTSLPSRQELLLFFYGGRLSPDSRGHLFSFVRAGGCEKWMLHWWVLMVVPASPVRGLKCVVSESRLLKQLAKTPEPLESPPTNPPNFVCRQRALNLTHRYNQRETLAAKPSQFLKI